MSAPLRPLSGQEETRRERVFRTMPPEPPELATISDPAVRAALRAIRAEYGALALRNARAIRRLLVILTVGMAVLVAINIANGIVSYFLSRDQADTVAKVQISRSVSLGVTCAVQSAVAQAGRETITGQTRRKPPPAVERAIERLGFPPYRIRKHQAQQQADGYVRSIAQSVERQVGSKGDNLINPDGTINCQRLAAVAHVPRP